MVKVTERLRAAVVIAIRHRLSLSSKDSDFCMSRSVNWRLRLDIEVFHTWFVMLSVGVLLKLFADGGGRFVRFTKMSQLRLVEETNIVAAARGTAVRIILIPAETLLCEIGCVPHSQRCCVDGRVS